MKKSLTALAVIGAFVGSAMAADVQLYGIVDTGLGYSHLDYDGFADDEDSFEMKSGQASGSRFGFKGTEELGNGLTVGFILENGIDSDTGADTTNFFNREASLFVQGSFGKVGMGRIGSFNNGQSSWAKMGVMSAFGTSSWGGFSAQLANLMSTAGQWDNMIAYETPSYAGFKVFAQYGMGNAITDNKSAENESSSDRYYALGVSYANGPLNLYAAVDSINYATFGLKIVVPDYIDDSLTVTLGGNYNFEVVKVFFGAQYFDSVKLSSIGGIVDDAIGDAALIDQDFTVGDIAIKGYGISLSASSPFANGTAMFGMGYVDAEATSDMEDLFATYGAGGAEVDLKRYVVSVGYDYPFSKRTDVYAVGSYMQDKLDLSDTAGTLGWDPSAYTLYVGLRHRF